MSSYMIRHVPEGVIPRAKAQARQASTTLDAVLVRFLEIYAAQGWPWSKAGQARAAQITPEERSEWGRKGGLARQEQRRQQERNEDNGEND